MDAAVALLCLLVAGVNFGWQPAENSTNGYEYIVQVEPQLLDGLQRGESIPIESNVPPEVGPISKVRIVVGNGDVPRDTVGAVQRTAYFAGQAAWSPEYNAAPTASGSTSTYDRYGQPVATSSTGVSPPPGVIDRTQAAVTETSNALRDGVEAGIQAANQQFSSAGQQVMDATRNASQDFNQQLQGFANDPVGQVQSATNSVLGTTEQSLRTTANQPQTSNPFAAAPGPQPAAMATSAQAGTAPPPWPQAGPQNSVPAASTARSTQTAAPGMAPVRTESGWTSIGTSAAPPLIIPQSLPTATNMAAQPVRMATAGPQFPATSWDTNSAAPPPSISRTDTAPTAANSARDLVQVQPPPGQQLQPSQSTTSTWDDPWARDPWGQTTQAQAASQPAQDVHSNPTITRDPAASWQIGASQPMLVPNQPTNQTIGTSPVSGHAPIFPQVTSQTATNPSLAGVAAEQVPWLPLLLVSLSLVGSLSANLFLGWSYLDARQKYRSLVRKTADTFRRVTSAAA